MSDKLSLTKLRRECRTTYPADLMSSIIDSEKLEQLLDIAEAAEKLNTAAQKIHDEIYPREIFVGCDDCSNETCDCDRGIQISRQLADGLDAYAVAIKDVESSDEQNRPP